MRKIVLVVSILLASSLSEGFGQKIYVAKGTAKIKMEAHLSRLETRDIAREQARHNAIETIFGTYVAKDAYVDIQDGSTDVSIKATSELKGEWLKTTREEFFEETKKVKNDGETTQEIWIVCELEGKVREFETPPPSFTFATSNCPDLTCETTDFASGESLYVTFETPEEGFLSIYLTDDETAYRILPYQEMPETYLHNVPVKADEQYVFFNVDQSLKYFEDFSYFMTDEIYLETTKSQEFLKLYVIFSPKPFKKPILDISNESSESFETPKTLSKKNFEVWVQDYRIYDTEFYYQTRNVRVRK
jgi:hypothetical protein